MILEILTDDSDKLREVCVPVELFDNHLKNHLYNMIETMYHSGGIGLASNQVGISKRIIVMDTKYKVLGKKPRILINPVILEDSGIVVFNEGCLSVPKTYGKVARSKRVVVEFKDENGLLHKKTFRGLESICIQHEIDHLNGILFTDKLSK